MEGATLRRLQVFAVVVERGGIGAAAEALGMTQPSVSAHVKALEGMLGRQLLHRTRGRRATSTAAGRLLYGYAQHVVSDAEDLRRRVDELARSEVGEVTIVVQRGLADPLVAPSLVEFARRFPGVLLSVRSGTVSQARQLLRAESAAFALIVTEGPLEGLDSFVLREEPLVLVAAPGSRLAHRAALSARELCREPFVSALRSSEYSQRMWPLLARAALAGVHVALEVEEALATKNLVRQGLGYAALPWSTVREDVEGGRLVTLDLERPLPAMEVRIAHLPRRRFRAAERKLLDLLCERIRGQEPAAVR